VTAYETMKVVRADLSLFRCQTEALEGPVP
jgi:hypothetical protein